MRIDMVSYTMVCAGTFIRHLLLANVGCTCLDCTPEHVMLACVSSIQCEDVCLQVTRDKLMDKYHEQWPHYNFAQHKGYGTAAHMAVMKQLGACPIHRRTFAPLKHWIEAGTVAFVDIKQVAPMSDTS